MDEEKVIPIPSQEKELSLMQMLDQWLKELIFPGEPKDFFQETGGEGEPGKVTRRFRFYTDEHLYSIVAIERTNGEESYLGCQVSTRKQRAGEDWTRGNDLPDGPFNKKTWDRIIYAIVSYELVKLSEYQRPDTIPEETA